MYCSECGQVMARKKAKFCSSCGSLQTPIATEGTTPYKFEPQANSISQGTSSARKSGQGVGIAGFIIGVIGLFIGLYDYSLLQGSFDYLLPEEIGILFTISATGIALSAVGLARKASIATWGFVLSGLSLLLTFYLASFG